MLAVGFPLRIVLNQTHILTGLYHKLHGVHRPVTMKKSIIKRRKRVVPATQEQDPTHAAHLTSFPASSSPRTQFPEALELRHSQQDSPGRDFNESTNLDVRTRDHQSDYHHQYEPSQLGVDFTHYQIDQHLRPSSQGPQEHNHLPLPNVYDTSALAPSPEPSRTLSPFPGATRKRSFSDAQYDQTKPATPDETRPNRLSSISSILNPTQRSSVDDAMIDPSLSSLSQQQQRRQSQLPQIQHSAHPPPPDIRLRNVTDGDPGGWNPSRAEKKARLRREAQEIRETLRAKERELEELEGDG